MNIPKRTPPMWAAVSQGSIWETGATPSEAIANALRQSVDEDGLRTIRMAPAAAEDVADKGFAADYDSFEAATRGTRILEITRIVRG